METSRRSLFVFLFFVMVSLRCYGEEGSDADLSQTNINANSPTALSVKYHPVASELEDQRNKAYNNVEVRHGSRKSGGGGGWRWGNGGVGGGGGGGGGSSSSGSAGGGGGWGWGGGGGGWWGWGCMNPKRNHSGQNKKRSFSNEDYKIGEFAECMGVGRCKGMRLDCPLHCGGPCFYDCKNMCKAHCRR